MYKIQTEMLCRTDSIVLHYPDQDENKGCMLIFRCRLVSYFVRLCCHSREPQQFFFGYIHDIFNF